MPAGIVNYRLAWKNEATHEYSDGACCVDVRGDALSVTFNGVGTLEVRARSTDNSNLSSIGLKRYTSDTEYEYIAGTYSSNNVQTLDYVEGPMYQVTGDGYSSITFTIDKAGVYIICTNDNNPEGDEIFNRNTRIQGIVMNDIYDTASTASIADVTSTLSAVGKIGNFDLYNGSKG